MLGWTQKEIGELLGVAQRTVSDDLSRNCETAKNAIRDLASQHIERHEIARRFNLPPVLVEAITLEGLDDAERDYTPAPERRGGLGAARGYWGLLGTTTKEQVSSSEHLNSYVRPEPMPTAAATLSLVRPLSGLRNVSQPRFCALAASDMRLRARSRLLAIEALLTLTSPRLSMGALGL